MYWASDLRKEYVLLWPGPQTSRPFPGHASISVVVSMPVIFMLFIALTKPVKVEQSSRGMGVRMIIIKLKRLRDREKLEGLQVYPLTL
jgi:hypothetical protein